MLNPSFAFLAMGLLALSAFACGSGSAAADGSTGGDAPVGPDGRITVDGPPVFDGSQAGNFITGDVDGVTVRVETDLMAGTAGVAAGQIWLSAGVSGAAWNVYITNGVGSSVCPPDWIAVYNPPGGGGMLRSEGGTCSVTVTRAAPEVGDVIEGTFTATLKTMPPSEPRTAVVTNGAFHVTRDFQ
jgi:hypothetical protein